MKKYTLYNGVEIPEIGYGTWLSRGDDAYRGTLYALKVGYRHIDSASAYQNEKEVGQAIKDSGIDRKDIFLTSKVPAEAKSYDEAKKYIEKSLLNFDLEYIDLMLIHCPMPWDEYGKEKNRYEKENLEVWKALTEAYKEGKIKAIGVSNFNIHDIKNINDNNDVKIMVNQIEINIGNTDKELIAYCQSNNIAVEAYCPNGHGRLMNNDKIKAFADKYHVTNAQLCIKYTLMLNTISLPKSLSELHIKENLDMNFDISAKDFELLKSIKL